MPIFRYKALAADGRVQQGEMEAPTQTAAIARLQNTGHLPLTAQFIATHPKSYFAKAFTSPAFRALMNPLTRSSIFSPQGCCAMIFS